MTKEEQLRMCLVLAFQSVITHSKDAEMKDMAPKIMELAKLMNEFCELHLTQTFPTQTISFVNDKGAAGIDAAIGQHLMELWKDKATQLPKDRELLIKYYDRLQQRKLRRRQWQFYAKAPVKKLSGLVLHYLDKEIEDINAGEVQ